MIKKRKIFFVLFLLIMNFSIVNALEDIDIPSGNLTACNEILGTNLTTIVKTGVTVIQIFAAILAIIKGMITLIPPILEKDADALKKASKTLITMVIVLVVVFLVKPLISFIGNLLDFDISCVI